MSDEENNVLLKLRKVDTAGSLGEQYIKDQAAIVDKAVSNADIVITTAFGFQVVMLHV